MTRQNTRRKRHRIPTLLLEVIKVLVPPLVSLLIFLLPYWIGQPSPAQPPAAAAERNPAGSTTTITTAPTPLR